MSRLPLKAGQSVVLAADRSRPEQVHEFEERSVMAVQAAHAARRPLLVRGEPGVGKTQLAAAVAKATGRVLISHVVDSRTEARDLLWQFDAVMRLAEAQLKATADLTPQEASRELAVARFVRPGPIWWAFHWTSAEAQASDSTSPLPAYDHDADPKNGCVLLIDEIDKAETDVPNGLLEALGARQFTPFGRQEPVVAEGEPPLVIITTNEERTLPDAFVRRCLVLRLALPAARTELIKLLVRRGETHFDGRTGLPAASPKLLQEAAEMLAQDREQAQDWQVKPLPGQAEYLDLVRAVLEMAPDKEQQQLKLLHSVREFALVKERLEEP
ncbi:MAG: AAA family ATPase [Pirellulaceae bacterium]|nr:AAA family ATPase [Pirellulaceae bacterium]